METNMWFWPLIVTVIVVTVCGALSVFTVLCALARLHKAYTRTLADVARAANYSMAKMAAASKRQSMSREDREAVRKTNTALLQKIAQDRTSEILNENRGGAEFSSGA